MASIKTNKGREKLAKAHNGTASLPAVVGMVFGTGGVDSNGKPRDLKGSETALFSKAIEKTGAQVTKTFPTPYTARYTCTLDADIDQLIGKDINEAGLVDAEGDLIAMKTFTNKGMETRMTIEFDYDAEF
ncbi:phage tail protein [Bacillus badius]|uniref:phage tail protein n=1 Tax=Bacillus badius TaxID=1455 RepID=UPI000597CAB0|nr:phage tail protein [Bacillus badius]KIL72557.1 hypothetical protein SD78_4142 [Bacillus badius]